MTVHLRRYLDLLDMLSGAARVDAAVAKSSLVEEVADRRPHN